MLTLLLALTPLPALAQDSSAEEQAAKSRETVQTPAAATIDWRTANAYASRSSLRSSGAYKALVEQADAVKLPVLMPDLGVDESSVTLVNGGSWYAMTLQTATATVIVHGFANAFEIPALQRELGRAGGARTSYADGILTVQFSRFGASYELEFECKDMSVVSAARATPTRGATPVDPLVARSPCMSDEQATTIAGKAQVVGGAP